MSASRTVVQIRCSEEEKARWSRRAGSRTLSDYVRFMLDGDSAPTQAVSPVQRKFAPDFKTITPPKKRKF